jgi:hypothetical protein
MTVHAHSHAAGVRAVGGKVIYLATLLVILEVNPVVKSTILVCCKLLKTKKVLEIARKQPGVADAFPVHGRWDIAVRTEDLDLRKIAEIGQNVYKAEGVEIVETLIGYPG